MSQIVAISAASGPTTYARRSDETQTWKPLVVAAHGNNVEVVRHRPDDA